MCIRDRLYILGDHIIDAYKDYREELTGLIERRGLREMVFFTGWRPDALAIVSLMDILVHPSLSEGFGRAVLEGMALGKAVIASRVGGLRELIEDDVNGLLVEPGNPSMIAAGLRRLLADRSFREDMGEEARRRVFSDYEITGRVRELDVIGSGMTLRKCCLRRCLLCRSLRARPFGSSVNRSCAAFAANTVLPAQRWSRRMLRRWSTACGTAVPMPGGFIARVRLVWGIPGWR